MVAHAGRGPDHMCAHVCCAHSGQVILYIRMIFMLRGGDDADARACHTWCIVEVLVQPCRRARIHTSIAARGH